MTAGLCTNNLMEDFMFICTGLAYFEIKSFVFFDPCHPPTFWLCPVHSLQALEHDSSASQEGKEKPQSSVIVLPPSLCYERIL